MASQCFTSLKQVHNILALPPSLTNYDQAWRLITKTLNEFPPQLQNQPVVLTWLDRPDGHEMRSEPLIGRPDGHEMGSDSLIGRPDGHESFLQDMKESKSSESDEESYEDILA